MPEVVAYACDDASTQFHRTTIQVRDPGPGEISFDVAYAGICHSDIHTARGEWGPASYPLVPGHEIAGIVTEIGEGVTTFAVGDKVGVGCMVGSCGDCEWCKDGVEQFCNNPAPLWTYGPDADGNPTAGGYAQKFTVRADFACHIPDAIPFETAAPLLCAGITTYSPLKNFSGRGTKVAVVGMGGLGHLAVQIAHALGAEVSVISQTRSKEADGRRFGAAAYYALSEEGTLKSLRNTFDVILCTVSADNLDYKGLIRTLRPFGVFVDVGLPQEAPAIPLSALVSGNKAIAGSQIGGIAQTQEMLDFCAEHGIHPQVEIISGDDITEAYDNVVASKVRYRYVIDTSTF